MARVHTFHAVTPDSVTGTTLASSTLKNNLQYCCSGSSTIRCDYKGNLIRKISIVQKFYSIKLCMKMDGQWRLHCNQDLAISSRLYFTSISKSMF